MRAAARSTVVGRGEPRRRARPRRTRASGTSRTPSAATRRCWHATTWMRSTFRCPNSLHVEWSLASARRRQARALRKAAGAAPGGRRPPRGRSSRDESVSSPKAFMYRHEPLTARWWRCLRDGAIGAVRTIASGFTYAQSRAGTCASSRRLGGGSLLDVGCYPVSYAVPPGRPRSSPGVAGSHDSPPSGVDEEFTGLLRFPGDSRRRSMPASARRIGPGWRSRDRRAGCASEPFQAGAAARRSSRAARRAPRIDVAGSPLLFVQQVEDFVPRCSMVHRRSCRSQRAARGGRAGGAATPRRARQWLTRHEIPRCCGDSVRRRREAAHAAILPGGPPFTLAFFVGGQLDRVENYDTLDLASSAPRT